MFYELLVVIGILKMRNNLHRQLCEIGVKFLKRSAAKNGHGCHFAVIEPAVYGENPDVFGVRHGTISKRRIGDTIYTYGHDVGTVVLEAKTSRSDFLNDMNKKHRAEENLGLGRWRYYICPENIIKIEDLPPKWGLIWVTKGGQIKVMAGAVSVKKRSIPNPMGGPDRKFRSMIDVQESFAAWSFEERNQQNEMNLLTMALARLDNVEDVLYLQREKAAIETRLTKQVDDLKQQLNSQQSELSSYQMLDALGKIAKEIAIPRKSVNLTEIADNNESESEGLCHE